MSQPKPEAVGARFAVLVIDMQKGILAETPEANKAVLPKINEVVAKARVAGVPVIWVQDSSYFQPGQEEYEVGEELDPRPEDIRVAKKYRDSFEGTVLGEELERLGVHELVVCGGHTDYCLLTTCSSAFVRGYGVTLVADAHLTSDQTEWGKPAPEVIVNFVNMYWDGMRAPERRGAAIPAGEVTFETE